MSLGYKQKRFIRKNHDKLTVKKIARKLGVRPKDVRRALRELGLGDAAPGSGQGQPEEKARWAMLDRLAGFAAFIKRPVVALPLVLGLATLLRAIYLIEVSDTPFFLHLHTDPWMYDHWARQIVAGDWAGRQHPVFYLGPAYPYFLAVVYTLFGASPLAACVIQLILSVASVGLVYQLGRRIFGPACGLLAGLLMAGYPMLIFFSGLLLGATLIVFLDLLALVLLVEGLRRPHWYLWVAAGVGLGLSACARGNVLLFAPLAALAVVLRFGFKAWKKWLPAGAWLAFAVVIAIMPVSLHNYLVGDDFVMLTSNAGANLFIGNNSNSDGIYMRSPRYKNRPMGLSVRDQQANFPSVARQELGRGQLKPSEVSSFWVEKTLEEIGSDPGRWLRLMGNKLKYFANAYEVPNNRNIYFSKRFSFILSLPLPGWGFVFPLALLGLVFSWRGLRKRFVLAGFVAAHLVALVLFFINGRYRLVLAPVMMIYAAATLRWLYASLTKRRYKIVSLAAAGLVLAFIATYLPVPHINYRANFLNLANAYRDLGQLERAIENYDAALDISPDFYYAIFKKGQVLVRLGRLQEAERTLKRARAMAKRNNDGLNLRRIDAELKRL